MRFATYLILTGTDEHWKDIIEQARKEYKQKKELAKKEKKEEKKDEKLDSSQELGKRSRKPTTCFKPEDDRADKYKKRKVWNLRLIKPSFQSFLSDILNLCDTLCHAQQANQARKAQEKRKQKEAAKVEKAKNKQRKFAANLKNAAKKPRKEQSLKPRKNGTIVLILHIPTQKLHWKTAGIKRLSNSVIEHCVRQDMIK